MMSAKVSLHSLFSLALLLVMDLGQETEICSICIFLDHQECRKGIKTGIR
ncbi:hypothetical protein CIPAW_09G065200 [Carya illinoinensis]|uniref:Uncharacterized protein n=1 Tax=Carya illinoinensis TaxID=32201 RepID=A0A8T1PEM2_CARIL|nr:hypothetical protein CIPAW_09G065200 [Carya illinoinensis]